VKSTYEKGKISFDFEEVVSSMRLEEKQSLIESLACDGELIKHIVAQVVDGCTENGFYSGTACVASEDPYLGLDWAKREVARRSNNVAANEIKRLEDAIVFEKKSHESTLSLLRECQNRNRY